MIAPPDGWQDVATPEELDEYLRLARALVERWEPEPHQVMPDLAEDWDIWALIGGRGTGKTDAGAFWLDKILTENPGWRARIIAPTLDDAKEACVEGPSGLKAHNPALRVNLNDHIVHWPNGSRARWYGIDKPDSVERLRAGGNSHIDWFEEIAAANYAEQAWVQADLGRRLGRKPRVIVTTTPKPRAIVRWLLGRPLAAAVLERHPEMRRPANVRVSRGTTDDNPHLEADRRQKYHDSYDGTRLGRQELGGDLLEDVVGALWQEDQLEADRVIKPLQRRWLEDNDWHYADDLAKVVVGVDPTGTETGDEVGIVVAGLCPQDGHGYVLEDRSGGGMSPEQWGRRVIQAYIDHEADVVVGEVNYGGDMVGSVVRQAARDMGVRVVFDKVTASRGKRVRAEPIAQLYEQHRIHHCGTHALLEEELTTWLPESGFSPNRLDALVWALHKLMPAAGQRRAHFTVV